ncbi:MAG: PepSY domain-containing protein [Marinospirillum sp.]|uniref:PepSY domain-containing protein n=1 Tax=Marinospirillum sp. TaxID=2183934 RepID=UPI0019F7BA2C|nr:PepSY domain-containing protein [Marinospirillum sp.]MBE0508588.1 PepSY domain-containing protein [Marinospirillum sp.]
MKKSTLILLVTASLMTGATLAKDKCEDPADTWQPRENLQKMLEDKGWQVNRIKVDDGCYEAKGTDTLGNRFEAKYGPATLEIRALKIKFQQQGTAEDYLDQ